MITTSFERLQSEFEMPEIQTFAPRGVSEHYGAHIVAARYCGVEPPVPAIRGAWTHAWIQRYVLQNEAMVREHLPIHSKDWGRAPLWTACRDDVEFIRSAGYEVRAIGAPMVYVPNVPRERRPGSLLVMPVHSPDGMLEADRLNFNNDYADLIAGLRERFARVVVCIHPSCLRNGYWIPDFQSRGIEMVLGSHYTDANGLDRMQALLSSFEYMTTNGFGSHIAYAAYWGAKVSVFGRYASYPSLQAYRDHGQKLVIDMEGNDYAQMLQESRSEPTLRRYYPELFCHPQEAKSMVDWARDELGHGNRVGPDEMRELFHWRDADLRRYRLLGRWLEALKESARSHAPAPLKAIVRALRSRLRG